MKKKTRQRQIHIHTEATDIILISNMYYIVTIQILHKLLFVKRVNHATKQPASQSNQINQSANRQFRSLVSFLLLSLLQNSAYTKSRPIPPLAINKGEGTLLPNSNPSPIPATRGILFPPSIRQSGTATRHPYNNEPPSSQTKDRQDRSIDKIDNR